MTPARAAATNSFTFASDGSAFLLNGQPFQIRSGEMHPARIPVEYWQHRIQMAKAMGLNTISIYLMWNYLEEKQGTFDLTTDRRDFAKFIGLCQQEGMWVLLRPGPYVCGEWDLGGLPSYLLANNPIALRVNSSSDPHYMAAVTRYVNAVAPVIKPLMIADGGPILMVQVENEYASYGSDATYMAQIQQLWINAGITGPFYTEDGLSQVESTHTNVSGGAIALSGGDASGISSCRTAFPKVPAMAGEVYPGWLTHWGESSMAGPSDLSGTLTGLMNAKDSFNLYMVHGGTSFGYWAGANANNDGSGYQADVTSYDYSAPITEQGRPTAAYTTYRNLLAGYVGALPAIPAPKPTLTLTGSQAPTPTVYASLWDNLPAPLPSSQTVNPQPMEMYGQNSGFMLYRKSVTGSGALVVTSVHDYATVFLGGKYQGGYSRPSVSSSYATPLKVTTGSSLTLPTGGGTLDILVEGMGRTNFGHGLVDRKGITQQVTLGGTTLQNWQTYALPVDESYVAGLRTTITDASRPGLFFRAAFTLTSVGDTYLDMSGWTKGLVWVNGHHLGRYWSIGPQHALFCPATWLTTGTNEVLVLDLHQTAGAAIPFHATLNNAYTLTNRASGKVLDDANASTTPGNQLIQWTANGGTNQQWRLTDLGNGVTTLTNVLSGLLADDANVSTADGNPIIQWPANGGTNQQWKPVATDSGYVKLVNMLSGKVMGVTGDSTADGAAIVQQTDTGSSSQQWILTPV
ncbi:beta-galactosidase [Catenulispora subtropica]